jgi:hypothetical protein
MWKANGKTTTLLLFLDSLSPKLWKRLRTCLETEKEKKKRAVAQLPFLKLVIILKFLKSNVSQPVASNKNADILRGI